MAAAGRRADATKDNAACEADGTYCDRHYERSHHIMTPPIGAEAHKAIVFHVDGLSFPTLFCRVRRFFCRLLGSAPKEPYRIGILSKLSGPLKRIAFTMHLVQFIIGQSG